MIPNFLAFSNLPQAKHPILSFYAESLTLPTRTSSLNMTAPASIHTEALHFLSIAHTNYLTVASALDFTLSNPDATYRELTVHATGNSVQAAFQMRPLAIQRQFQPLRSTEDTHICTIPIIPSHPSPLTSDLSFPS